eukprot:5590387-Karenia_brevis.AAC.1
MDLPTPHGETTCHRAAQTHVCDQLQCSRFSGIVEGRCATHASVRDQLHCSSSACLFSGGAWHGSFSARDD